MTADPIDHRARVLVAGLARATAARRASSQVEPSPGVLGTQDHGFDASGEQFRRVESTPAHLVAAGDQVLHHAAVDCLGGDLRERATLVLAQWTATSAARWASTSA